LAIDHEDPDLPARRRARAAAEQTRATPGGVQSRPGWAALEVSGEHRVAVHTRGGRTLRGTLRDVDLSKSQFPLVPQGGGEPETIYHSDVKAIFFMLAPGEKGQAGDGAKVRVTFADGRSIEGIRDGADAEARLLPGPAGRRAHEHPPHLRRAGGDQRRQGNVAGS